MQCFIEALTDIVSELAFQNKLFPGTFSDLDCRPKMTLLPPLGNFADIVYLKEQSFLHRIRDVCTL